ncbi:collagen alpha-1(XII) chain-like [Ciona intestinalis]
MKLFLVAFCFTFMFVAQVFGQCANYDNMDFVVAVDSSKSMGKPNFVEVKRLVVRLINSFNTSPTRTRVSMYKFTTFSDRRSELYLNEKMGNKRLQRKEVWGMPYKGYGSYVGKALSHAFRVSFTERLGDRPGSRNVLLVITDGRSYDGVRVISERLRNLKDVMIYAIGVVPVNGRGIFQRTLTDMTNDMDRVFLAPTGDWAGPMFERLVAQFTSDFCN